jgi:hypothetical protein
MTMVALLDPISGRPLVQVSRHVLSDGASRWPLLDGIAYLRFGPADQAGPAGLRHAALAAIDAGDERGALALLLTDQDSHAPLPAPSLDTTRALVDAVRAEQETLRGAMRALNFGPVADYFAHRTSTPTFLSGLALLAHAGRPQGLVVEIACGVGHFLRELSAHGVPALGVDLVFAKLWLARHFVATDSTLVCADAVHVPVACPPATTVFCHDAFYFFADKAQAAQRWMQLAGDSGNVLIGHAHSALVAQSVAGSPLTPAGYAALFPGCTVFDDADLTASALAGTRAPHRDVDTLGAADAVAMVWLGQPSPEAPKDGLRDPWWPDILLSPAATPLHPNPLLGSRDGCADPLWPSPRFAAEYAPLAGYLDGPMPSPQQIARAAQGMQVDGEIAALARRRVLVDLPERW